MTPAKLATARQLLDNGAYSIGEVAEIIGVGRSTLYRYLEPTA